MVEHAMVFTETTFLTLGKIHVTKRYMRDVERVTLINPKTKYDSI